MSHVGPKALLVRHDIPNLTSAIVARREHQMPELRKEFHPLNALGMSFVSMQPLLRNKIGLVLALLLHVGRSVYKFAPLSRMQDSSGLKCILLTRSPWLLVS